MKQESTTITLDGIEFEVDYTYSPPYREARDSLNGIAGAGAPLEPDEDESIEISYVFHADEDIYCFLSVETLHRIENAVLEGRRDVSCGDL